MLCSAGTIPIMEEATYPLLGDTASPVSPPAPGTVAAALMASSPSGVGVGHLTTSVGIGSAPGVVTSSPMTDDHIGLLSMNAGSIEARDMSGGSLLGDTRNILAQDL